MDKECDILYTMSQYRRGNADVLFFAGFFIVLFVLWWASGAGQKGADSKPRSLFSVSRNNNAVIVKDQSDADTSIKYNKEGQPLSPWQGKVKISSLGSAKSQYDPDLEYIVLKASGNKEPINITGWSLLNGRNRNAVAFNISEQKGVANQVYVPQAHSVYSANSFDLLQPVRLAAGAEAVIVTGRTPGAGSYSGSFRTNSCLGYLEEDDEKFYPAIKVKCPDPEAEPGIEFVNNKCREFIEDMAGCHVPEFSRSLVDDQSGLSSTCRQYLRDHYSYRGCVANHINDKGFYGAQWRIYLNRPWEMWGKSGEVITLLDDRGLVVDQKAY